jgi:hypothetical protein
MESEISGQKIEIRLLILLVFVLAVFQGYQGWRNWSDETAATDRRSNFCYALGSVSLQLLLRKFPSTNRYIKKSPAANTPRESCASP